MNKSLDLKANYLMVAVWLLSLAVVLYIGGADAIKTAGITSVAGILAGYLQLQALLLKPQEFKQAETAMEVRHVMLSTKQGKASIVLLWLMGIITVACIILLSLEQPIAIYMAAYTAFAFTRDVVAMPGLKRLANAT